MGIPKIDLHKPELSRRQFVGLGLGLGGLAVTGGIIGVAAYQQQMYAAWDGALVEDKPYVNKNNMCGWDFTDWDYVAKMKAYADHYNSWTNWFMTADCNPPVRAVIFHRDDAKSEWVACGGWYCGVGRRHYQHCNGLSQGAVGPHFLQHRWSPEGRERPAGLGYCTDYIECYYDPPGVPDGGANNSAAVHGGWPAPADGKCTWGYGTHSCVSLNEERAKWVYYNLDWFTTLLHIGEDGEHGRKPDYDSLELGTPGGWTTFGESDLMPWEGHEIEQEDPFGLDGAMPDSAILEGDIPWPDGKKHSKECEGYYVPIPAMNWGVMGVGDANAASG